MRARVLTHLAPAVRGRKYILYRMQFNRRVEANHALNHAVELANEAGLPLLIYEANDPMRKFSLEGFAGMGAGYFFDESEGADAFDGVARDARCVVTDDHPYSIPAEVMVDSSCIVPMSVHEKRAYGAYTIRPKMKRELPNWLKPVPPVRLKARWRGTSVRPSKRLPGGGKAAAEQLQDFLEHRLARYARDKNEPSKKATSGLSPYLHFGYISSLQVALAVNDYAREHKLIADEFLEELIVRRELAFNFARFTPGAGLHSLPDWCQRTINKHAGDPRPFVYSHAEFEKARTHDDLWNAAQRELLLRGVIHGYYRMYWGKKIIEWSKTYEDAFQTMTALHDRHALDGRDPNTVTNILWCFGLHDRPWGERPVFGQIRYMSLDGMRRKTDTRAYIAEMAAIR